MQKWKKRQGNWDSISFAIISFILIISMWWQYFDNMEKELKKSRQTSGQIIIYGHLLILMSLSMVAHPLDYYFTWGPIFFYPIFYFWICIALFSSTTIIFHQYMLEQHRLKIYHFACF
ncbi:low temperature requirement protein A [Peribacillus frigoritolerans]|uniref:low temperature requirement protein A n=1 Tax=Peribacillus frigoritolerans TaxID=450367 RepID=UPI00399FFC85